MLRETGPWSPAVHRLLRHLDGRLPHVPRFHGVDDRGREVLDFLPGHVVDVEHEELSDAQLGEVVAWTRALHAATADFDDPGPWRFRPPATADVLGHNDVAPYNVCFDGDRLAGVFDWDLAGPTTVLDELGFIAWSCVPLYRRAPVDDADAWTADRLVLVARTYGDVEPHDVLDATVTRTERTITGMLAAAEAGDVGMRRLMAATGEPGPTRAALDGLRTRVPALHAAVDRASR